MADKAMTEKDLAVTAVLGVEPLTVETRPAGLAADPTPTEAVFIRNNLGPPAADGPWTVELTGTVSEARLSLEDVFGSLPRHDITMVLQCAGNGRSRLPEPVPGVQWERGAMACVEWSGVLLADLVAAYGGPAEDFAYVTVLGGDAPADDPSRVERSIPAHAALADGLLADRRTGAASHHPWRAHPVRDARLLRRQQREVGAAQPSPTGNPTPTSSSGATAVPRAGTPALNTAPCGRWAR